ncbi:MAG: signal peptidase II [Candidatus Woesearchaeota archaeon]|nr:signal peptidase II [Candidatus Woesearchaeota archaeon]
MKKIYIIALIVIFLDQITKYIFKNYFTYTKNYGAAFGILQNQQIFFIIISIIAIITIILIKKDLISLGFLLGGVIGNLIDRSYYGYVIDFIDLKIWPSFNLADAFSTIGVILLIIYIIRNDINSKKP